MAGAGGSSQKATGFKQLSDGAALRQALSLAGTAALTIAPATEDIYYHHRRLKDGELFFLVNNHAKREVTGEFNFLATGSAEIWDPATGLIESVAAAEPAQGARSTVSLTLGARQNRFIRFYSAK
ncbi:MAG: glycosyl hydrolase [Kiritimatiellae bacterium]|nr:glycosyl hydrolase [Kiritimatiellia bacterium]